MLSAGQLALGPTEAIAAETNVLARTTGDFTERLKTIPITRGSGARKKAVASMGPEILPQLQQDDGVEVTAELKVTTDCTKQSQRCAGLPYKYNPIVTSRLVLADSAKETGSGTEAISDRHQFRCRQRHPGREHHCVIVFTDAGFSESEARDQGCAPDTCRVNLVLDAHNRRARGSGKDKLVIGGNQPDGHIAQDMARINAIRFRPDSQPRPPATTTSSRETKRLPLTADKNVVYSERLDGLRAGEQLAVHARMRTDIDHLPYSVRVTSNLLLTEGRGKTHPSEFINEVATHEGEITEANGFNCVHQKSPCLTEKVGVLRVKEDVGKELYVNLVVLNSAKRADPKGGDAAKVTDAGELKVVRYPP